MFSVFSVEIIIAFSNSYHTLKGFKIRQNIECATKDQRNQPITLRINDVSLLFSVWMFVSSALFWTFPLSTYSVFKSFYYPHLHCTWKTECQFNLFSRFMLFLFHIQSLFLTLAIIRWNDFVENMVIIWKES